VNTIPGTVDPDTAAKLQAGPTGAPVPPVVDNSPPNVAVAPEVKLGTLATLEAGARDDILKPAASGLAEAAGVIGTAIDGLLTQGIADVPTWTAEGVQGAETLIESLAPPSVQGIIKSVIGVSTPTVNALETIVDTKLIQGLTLLKARLDALNL
jgi:hypothetical protein